MILYGLNGLLCLLYNSDYGNILTELILEICIFREISGVKLAGARILVTR